MPVFVGAGGTYDSKVSGGGKGVSIGTTNTTGRDAGIGTATGTLIYNNDDRVVEVYNGAPGWQIVGTQAPTSGIIGASGGTLVAPNPGGYELRHFPSGPTSFTYTSAGSAEIIHVLVVAGGGGGHFGGGGGGGIAYAYNLPVPAAGTTYPISIGGGGSSGGNGGNSTFAGHPVGTITAAGGGGSTTPQPGNSNTRAGAPGGSGGGGGHDPQTIFGTTIQPSQNPGYTWPGGSLYQYGQPGGPGGTGGAPACCEGGAGGGAAGPAPLTGALPAIFRETGTYNGPQASAGIGGDQNGGGAGGNGITLGWIPESLGDSGYFGGGGGGAYAGPGGGAGGGGDPSNNSANSIMGQTGQANTGGGGGASNDSFRAGGTGIVLVYYQAV